MNRRPGPTSGISRAPGGQARVKMSFRIGRTARDQVQQRADLEADSDASEMLRRLIKWALYGSPMPEDYR